MINLLSIRQHSMYFLSVMTLMLAQNAFAVLPSPLDSEYTVVGTESVAKNSVSKISSIGILNIGGDSESGVLELSYDKNMTLLENNGVINIGTGNSAGTLSIDGSYAGELVYGSLLIDGTGTYNVGANGTLEIKGANHYKWNSFVHFQNLNISGKFVYTATRGEGYIGIANMNLYDGASFSSVRRVQIRKGGTWNLYTDAFYTSEIRVDLTENTINLHSENALANVKYITMDTNGKDTSLRLTTGEYSQKLGRLDSNTNSIIDIVLAQNKSGLTFSIAGLETKQAETMNVNSEIVFENFANDFVKIENISNLTFVDNKIFIANRNSYITITALDNDGNEILGDWYWEITENGAYLNNTGYIPEPAGAVALCSVIALAIIAFRKRLSQKILNNN